MLNSCELVGKVVGLPEISTTQKGVTVGHMLVEADRNFRNEDGNFASDTFNVTLWKGIAEECMDVCKDGSIVAIRGRLRSEPYESNGRTFYNCEVIAEKVSYLDQRMKV